MPLDCKSEPLLAELLGAKFMRVYATQPEEGRAALLAFLHLADHDPARVIVRFDLKGSGRMHLIMEAEPD